MVHPVTKFRRSRQDNIKKYLGNECMICGYKRCKQALESHHVIEEDKSFNISKKGLTCKWETLIQELNKCILLCSNCHREYHYGMIHKTTLSEALRKDLPKRKERAETIITTPKPKLFFCCECGKEISYHAKRCLPCSWKHSQKIEWPSVEELRKRVENSTWEAVGNELDVSSNAIRKRIKRHGG